jgi:hypothetical protein
MKQLTILLLLLAPTLSIIAQKTNFTGYYITPEGQSISGKFPNYIDNAKTPLTVKFEDSASSRVIELSPSKCRSLVVEHFDRFIAFKGRRLSNPTEWRNIALHDENKDTFEEVSGFLRVLFDNEKLGLYQLIDNKRTNYYVSVNGKAPEELLYKVSLDEYGGVRPSTVFKVQLIQMLKEYGSEDNRLESRMEGVTYSSKSLLALFQSITGSLPPKEKRKYPLQVFGGIGISFNKFHVAGDASNVAAGNYKTQESPVFEIGVKIFNQRNFGRVFVLVRANYYQYKNFSDDVPSPPYQPGFFKASVLSFPVSIGYEVIDGSDVKVSASLGVAPIFLQDNKQYQDIVSPQYQASDNLTTLAFTAFGELEAEWKKKITLFVGDYLPNGVGEYTEYYPRHSSIKIGFRCKFL